MPFVGLGVEFLRAYLHGEMALNFWSGGDVLEVLAYSVFPATSF